MRTIPAPRLNAEPRLHAQIEDALEYADHVLSNPATTPERQADARRLKELAQAQVGQMIPTAPGARLPRAAEIVTPVAYALALLRGSAPVPRPMSLVKVDLMAMSPDSRHMVHGRAAYRTAESLLFLGEHPNMPGHGAVQDVATGTLSVGVHLTELVETPTEG